MLVRFVFRYLIKGIRTRALRKRHSASFLAADRRLLQSIKIANQGCFAKGKNESLSYALNRDSARCVASCRLRREPLRRKAGAPLLRVNSPASLLHEPFLSAIGKNRSFWAVFACFIVYFYTFGTTFHKKCAIICIKRAPAFCASLTLEYFPTISY